ncbi:MAG: hypothetical protein QXK12_04700 [Candidatus Nezhaarchaeales archaeon]
MTVSVRVAVSLILTVNVGEEVGYGGLTLIQVGFATLGGLQGFVEGLGSV